MGAIAVDRVRTVVSQCDLRPVHREPADTGEGVVAGVIRRRPHRPGKQRLEFDFVEIDADIDGDRVVAPSSNQASTTRDLR